MVNHVVYLVQKKLIKIYIYTLFQKKCKKIENIKYIICVLINILYRLRDRPKMEECCNGGDVINDGVFVDEYGQTLENRRDPSEIHEEIKN